MSAFSGTRGNYDARSYGGALAGDNLGAVQVDVWLSSDSLAVLSALTAIISNPKKLL